MQDQIWVAIELRRDDLERQAHAVYSRAGFAPLWLNLQPMKRITTAGRSSSKGRPRVRRSIIVADGDPIWLTSGYLILAHDGEPDFWRRVLTLKWPRGGPIAEQPVRIAGCDVVPANAVLELVDRCGEAPEPIELPTLTEGQRVRILADVFAGHSGEIGDIDGDRATVWVRLFGRPTRVQTDVGNLEAA